MYYQFASVNYRGAKALDCSQSRIFVSMKQREIYLAGGCFWGTEHFFKQVRGVVATEVGYANGRTADPTYEAVCRQDTGHAETVRVAYDEDMISLDLILQLHFRTIDPTSLNKQGGDVGTQYRTGIYYTDPDDEAIIRKALDELSARYTAELRVECEPLRHFYNAEDYHQDYLDKNPRGYCHIGQDLFILAREANKA